LDELERHRDNTGGLRELPDVLPPACWLVWRSRVGCTSRRTRCLATLSARNDRAVEVVREDREPSSLRLAAEVVCVAELLAGKAIVDERD